MLMLPPPPFDVSLLQRRAWALASLVATLLYALPLLLVVSTTWDYSMFACESVSYRYGACFRIQHGEGASVWLPQGQLLGLIQHVLFFVMSHLGQPTAADLRWSVNLFGLLSTLTNIGLVGTIFYCGGQNRYLTWSDKALLLVTSLAPIFLTDVMGPYYSILPDYHALNMALLVAGLYLFLLQVRGGWSPPPLVLGVMVGCLLANKVSLVFVAVVIVAPSLVPAPFRLLPFLNRCAIAGSAALATFVLVFLGFYLFRLQEVAHMLGAWADFLKNPGGEPSFWQSTFEGLSWHNRYGVLCGIAIAAVVGRLVIMFREPRPDVRRSLLLLSIVTALAGGAYVLMKRPAGSTYYEVTNIFVVVGAMALGSIGGDRSRCWAILGVITILLTLALTDLGSVGRMAVWVRATSSAGKPMWWFHQEMLDRGKGRPVVVIVPDNSHNYAGPEELLLKGFSVFPTWETSPRGAHWVRRLAPGVSFRFNGSQVPPEADFPRGAAVVWFESPDVPHPPTLYPRLAELPRRPDVSHFQWSLRSVLPNKPIEAHLCLLPN